MFVPYMGIEKIDINSVIYDLKDSTWSLKDYLRLNFPEHLSEEGAIYELIMAKQEIALCEGCYAWFECGELNEQSECEHCNTMED